MANTQGSQLTDERPSLKAVEDRVPIRVNVPKHRELVRAIGWFQQPYVFEWLRYLRIDLLARLAPYRH